MLTVRVARGDGFCSVSGEDDWNVLQNKVVHVMMKNLSMGHQD